MTTGVGATYSIAEESAAWVTAGAGAKVSSEVTKVPLAELRRLFVTESKLSEYMERKDRKKTSEVQGER